MGNRCIDIKPKIAVKLLSDAERMMCQGNWDVALSTLGECRDRALMSAAEHNLEAANLEWRRQCAAAGMSMLEDGPVLLETFRAALEKEFDPYVVGWLLRDFKLLRVVPGDGAYVVEVA